MKEREGVGRIYAQGDEKCQSIKKGVEKQDPPLGIPSALFPSVRMCVYVCVLVYVCVCVRFHSVNSSISPTGGITKKRKGKVLQSPRKRVDAQF